MTGNIAGLIVLAFLMTHLMGPMVMRAGWLRRHAGVAVVVWAGVVASVVVVLLALTGAMLAWPPGPVHSWVEHLRSCLPGHTHSGELATMTLALVSGGMLLRTLCVGAARARHTIAERQRHHDMVRLVARYPDDPNDVCLIEHPALLVYCLPRRSRPIVMTTGALERLDADELSAVLEHERTHLRRRHHLLLAVVDAVQAALPWSATIRHAREELSRLVEMVADDAAAHRYGHAPVIGALRRLGLGSSPPGGLAATGETRQLLDQRIARLESHEVPGRLSVGAAIALALSPALALVIVAVGLQLSC
ncbi:M56 family metallopeptidase [Nonomuraea turkmeniaca]|uniref:M56 family metallopeptidase n=1 Tax=Nonomuraea turkmeniaca TaxID=103838 RepID=A0A5S4F0U9_9ACTN|nr:M56 family metallopeptidase [Nonomuraea turkmeniaca]TMR09692.1 M56 family metallopeptidase [Nonomuraea turkmeniaca]